MNSILIFLKHLFKYEYLITKQENTLLLTQIETSLCIVGSPSHQFIIISFYDEGAGLVVVYWARLKFLQQNRIHY